MTATSDVHVRPSDDAEAVELVSLDSLTAEHTGRWTFLIVEGAAFMMQAMHPVIAEVTGKYSASFQGDAGGRAIRSIDSVLRWTYGGTSAVAEGNRVRAMHKPMTMKSEATGKQISALNPEAYQWVIVTGYLVNAQGGRLLIGREFTDAEKAELLRDNRKLARLLHVPMRGYPETHEQMTEYFESMVDTLQATPQAMSLMDDLITGHLELGPSVPKTLYPLLGLLLRPALRFNYLSIVGLLDPRLRAKLGVTWSAAEERQLQRIYTFVRIAYRVLPDRLTYFPLAYHARKHHECLQKMEIRQQKSYAYRIPNSVSP
jgi:uncharacterized protein (DUF2236 family)